MNVSSDMMLYEILSVQVEHILKENTHIFHDISDIKLDLELLFFIL